MRRASLLSLFAIVSALPLRAAADAVSWSLDMSAGAGIGMRALDLPSDGVVYQTRTGVFPAADLAFELDHAPSNTFRIGLHARYQTSIGLHITEQHTDGSEHEQTARSNRVEVAIAPTLRFDDAGQWALIGSLGWCFSELRPESHVFTPAYVLSGPFLRAELLLPLGTERLRLRLGPEAQWIVQVGGELRERGMASSGLGAGGSAAIQLVIGGGWIVDATYRELHSWLDSPQAQSLHDASRFVTARLTGSL
jgi:hypothetical protein